MPVLFGSDLEDDEEAETNSPYLLHSAGDPQALPAAARQRLLTDGSKEPAEEAKGEKDGALVAAAKEGDEGEVDDGEVVIVSRRVSQSNSKCPITSKMVNWRRTPALSLVLLKLCVCVFLMYA